MNAYCWSGATAGLITVEFNYDMSYITTESLISLSIHPLAPLTRWYHAVCAQSAYRVHTAIVLSENERSRATPTWNKPVYAGLQLYSLYLPDRPEGPAWHGASAHSRQRSHT